MGVFTDLAKIGVAAILDPTGTSSAITAGQAAIDQLTAAVRDRNIDCFDRVVRGISDRIEILSDHTPIARHQVEWVVQETAKLLAATRPQPDDLARLNFDLDQVVQHVLDAGKPHLSSFSAEEEALCRDVVIIVFDTFLNDPDALSELEPSFRKAVLTALQKRPALRAAKLLDRRSRSWHRLLPESVLLRADYGVVGFQGREREMADIAAWCGNGQPFGVRLYTGAGGMGKTRLWMHACHALNAEGWRAGFLSGEADTADFETLDALLRPERLLLVVDYAETRRDGLVRLLDRAQGRITASGSFRLVLLARSAGEWWDELADAGASGDIFHGAAAETFVTGQLAADEDRRLQYFEDAARAFSAKLESAEPIAAAPDLSQPHFDRALYLHMAALAAVHGQTIDDAGELLDFVLRRERALWNTAAPEGIGAAEFAQAVAVATLSGGADGKSAGRSLVARTPLMAGQSTASVNAVADRLRGLYPGDRWLNGLQPDVLGEHLVARELNADGGVEGKALLATVLDSTEGDRAKTALTVLTRLAQRDPAQAKWLTAALEGRLDRLAGSVIDVAIETGDPIGAVAATVLETAGSASLAADLMATFDRDYQQTVVLRELAAVASQLYLDHLRAIPEPRPEEADVETVRVASNLGVRLSNLGRREEALTASEEAVAIYRTLAETRSDAFLPSLATSLNNLSTYLSNVGRREEALAASEEAVAIRRTLAETRPDAFLPDLATSLNNLSTYLSNLGRREEALAASEGAAAIRRALAEAWPDAFLPNLATSLNNLGMMYSNLGRREEALAVSEEAVAIQRTLAEARPDAFLPDLATSLNNLGIRFSDLGRREEALVASEEAVAIRRTLAEARPHAFLPDLATSLNNLSGDLSNLGRREEALVASEEAVAIRRTLAEARPDAFLPDLARSLSVMGDCLEALNRTADAVKADEDAVEKLSASFLALPQAFAGLMGAICRDYIRRCETVGREPDAALLTPVVEKFAELQAIDAEGGEDNEG